MKTLPLVLPSVLLWSLTSATPTKTIPRPAALDVRDLASTCTPTPSARAGYVCNKEGSIMNNAGILSTFTSCTGDYLGCYQVCYQNTACISFSFDSSTQSCTTYSKQILKSKFKAGATGVKFWNRRNCFKVPSCTDTVCPQPAQCSDSPQGVQFAKYSNPYTFDPSRGASYLDSFEPEYFESAQPDFVATTGYIGNFPASSTEQPNISIYDTPNEFNHEYFVVSHQGYINAPSTGNYTIRSFQPDDLLYVWTGANAKSGYTRSNADLVSNYNDMSFTFHMNVLDYLPFRIMYVNGPGQYDLEATITDPDGNVLLGPSSTYSNRVVQYACNSYKALPFPPWGSGD